MDGHDEFKELFQQLINHYELSPEIAAQLLQNILRILTEQGRGNGQG